MGKTHNEQLWGHLNLEIGSENNSRKLASRRLARGSLSTIECGALACCFRIGKRHLIVGTPGTAIMRGKINDNSDIQIMVRWSETWWLQTAEHPVTESCDQWAWPEHRYSPPSCHLGRNVKFLVNGFWMNCYVAFKNTFKPTWLRTTA